MTITWTPEDDQYGPQSICAGAVDNNNLQSDAWCVTYLVGFESPNLIRAQAVQGSASPMGTVFQNQTIFSVRSYYYTRIFSYYSFGYFSHYECQSTYS